MRGYFEIGIYNGKTEQNLGTLWRSAYQLGAAGIFTIGKRYNKQSSDTLKTWRHIPLREYENICHFLTCRPYDCLLIGIEMGGQSLSTFKHPERCIYLLGAEDHGLSEIVKGFCNHIVSLESINANSYNVAITGSVVMYDRNFSNK